MFVRTIINGAHTLLTKIHIHRVQVQQQHTRDRVCVLVTFDRINGQCVVSPATQILLLVNYYGRMYNMYIIIIYMMFDCEYVSVCRPSVVLLVGLMLYAKRTHVLARRTLIPWLAACVCGRSRY